MSEGFITSVSERSASPSQSDITMLTMTLFLACLCGNSRAARASTWWRTTGRPKRVPTGRALRVARLFVLAAACVRLSGATTSGITAAAAQPPSDEARAVGGSHAAVRASHDVLLNYATAEAPGASAVNSGASAVASSPGLGVAPLARSPTVGLDTANDTFVARAPMSSVASELWSAMAAQIDQLVREVGCESQTPALMLEQFVPPAGLDLRTSKSTRARRAARARCSSEQHFENPNPPRRTSSPTPANFTPLSLSSLSL